MSTQQRSRPLGALEHCLLSLTNVGVPSTVALAAVVRSEKSPLHARLPAAIATLLNRYPLLRCRIVNAKTDAPYWHEDDSSEPAQLIGVEEAFSKGADTCKVLHEALALANELDGTSLPTWRVWLADAPVHGQTRVVLGVSHVVTDGSGARDLMADLLFLLRDDTGPSETATALAQQELPPSLETVMERLPAVAGPSAAPEGTESSTSDPLFLKTPVSPPHLQPTAVRLVKLPASTVVALKRQAKANGVATLHAVLYITALVALQKNSGSAPVAIKGTTPVSARALESQLPRATGNYVYEVNSTHDDAARVLQFWEACAAYARRLNNSATRERGLEEMRQLADVPNVVAREALSNPLKHSAFDRWRLAQLAQVESFQTTFEVSNLGVTPPTGWENDDGLLELVWAQSAMLRTAFAFNVRCNLCWQLQDS